MTFAFWLTATLMLAVALAFVLPVLLRGGSRDPRMAALDAARREGVLDEDEYQRKRAAIGAAPAENPRASGLAWVVLLGLPALAIGLYLKLGDLRVFDPQVQAVEGAMRDAQKDGLPPMDQAIAGLAQRLERQPDDLEGWLLLGRAYRSMERFGAARDAFAKADALAPDTPEVMVEYAEAQVLASDSKRFEGEPLALLQHALELAPDQQRGLWLLGISQYQNGDIPAATTTWERLLATLPEDNPTRESLRQRIEELKAQAGAPATPSAALATDATVQTVAAHAPRLTIDVSLSSELARHVQPDDTLFVFARAAEGPRVPLAIQRLRAGDLPARVTLDDTQAMVPQMNLSSQPRIIVDARISRSGTAQAQSGDLQTASEVVPNTHQEPITLIIDERVP